MAERPSTFKFMREVSAMLTQARYLGFDWTLTETFDQDAHVVFIHGLYASAGVFRPLKEALTNAYRVGTSSFSYLPGVGIELLTDRLDALLRELKGQYPVILVGHSLGGLVVRQHVRRLSRDPRVVQTISLAAPFLGTHKHQLVPGQAGRDLTPGAQILSALVQNDLSNQHVPHLSLLAEHDQLIVPGAIPKYGEHQIISGAGHNGILFDRQAIASVLDKVDACINGLRT